MTELYYCRMAVPETDDSDEQRTRALALARDYSIGEVKRLLRRDGVDFERGSLRVTESMNSTLEREYVIAEWVPND